MHGEENLVISWNFDWEVFDDVVNIFQESIDRNKMCTFKAQVSRIASIESARCM